MTCYRHDGAGRVVGLEHPVSGRLDLQRDPDGRLLALSGPGLRARFSYTDGGLTGLEWRGQPHQTTRLTRLTRDEHGRVVAADTVNVALRTTESPHSGSVFWSGYEEGNKDLAQEFARRTGGKTVEMTQAGRWLEQHHPYDDLVRTFGRDAANDMWDGVAERFVRDASGEANAFIYKMRDNPDFPNRT